MTSIPQPRPADIPGGSVGLLPSDHELLVELLSQCTVNPLERTPPGSPQNATQRSPRNPPHQLRAAGLAYAEAAATLGFCVVQHASASPEMLRRPDVPRPVRQAADDDPGFLHDQPNLLLRLGPPRPPAQTVMFNVHLDTVAGYEPPGFDGETFTGRGAIDAKGPAVALLAGLRGALMHEPVLTEKVSVLIQAVAGEEGGALGVYGTRPLVDSGAYGRLNVFCEPTALRYLPRATAAMTARLRVCGRDAIDDRPGDGHNATVLLGFLAQHLAVADLSRRVPGTGLCVAGIHTGTQHNRVYGTGELLLNLSYPDRTAGARLETELESALAAGLREFRARFAETDGFALTARDAGDIVGLDWDKRGLPALAGLPDWAAGLLESTGVRRWPDTEPAFTCDAIWLAEVPDCAAVVLGPGDLAANRAHAPGEFARLADLDAFADVVARLVPAFARLTTNSDTTTAPPPGPAKTPAE